jgi:hypothetical protein
MLRKVNTNIAGATQSMTKRFCQQPQLPNNHVKLKTKFSQACINDCMTLDEFDELLTKTIEAAYEQQATTNQ